MCKLDSADLRQWAIYKKRVYDLSDYLYTVKYYSASSGTDLPNYGFFNSDVSSLFSTNTGQDITKALDKVFAGMSTEDVDRTLTCLNTAFYYGETDFRKEAKCTVQNYLLLAFSIIIITTIAAKCEFATMATSSPQSSLRSSSARSVSPSCSTSSSCVKYPVTRKAKNRSSGRSTR